MDARDRFRALEARAIRLEIAVIDWIDEIVETVNFCAPRLSPEVAGVG